MVSNVWNLNQFEDFYPMSAQIMRDTVAISATNGMKRMILTYTTASAPFVFAGREITQDNSHKMYSLTRDAMGNTNLLLADNYVSPPVNGENSGALDSYLFTL
jgi:hypothetical protein